MQAIPIGLGGRFSGYASVFGQVDDGGDIVMPGAFAKSLAKRGRDNIRMLFQHDPKDPVGVWDKVVEDGFGLWVEGRLIGGVPRADALRRLIENGAIDGLSIGFRTVRATRETAGQRKLWQVDLWEVSIVTFPMMPAARIAPGAQTGDSRLLRSLDAAIGALRA